MFKSRHVYRIKNKLGNNSSSLRLDVHNLKVDFRKPIPYPANWIKTATTDKVATMRFPVLTNDKTKIKMKYTAYNKSGI